MPTPVPIRIPFIGLPIASPSGNPATMHNIRKNPPARLARLVMAAPMQAKHGQRNVDDTSLQSGKGAPVNVSAMDSPFIHGRPALADASDLIERYGDDAGFQAAVRAEQSRDRGNVIHFCHWRQIERLIATLSSDEITGTIH